MPRYNYECERCGPFEEYRPMAEFDAALACPQCNEPAPRMLAVPHMPTLEPERRLAFAVNEKSAHAPDVRAAHVHGPNCGCGGSRKATGARTFRGRRPWMLSH